MQDLYSLISVKKAATDFMKSEDEVSMSWNLNYQKQPRNNVIAGTSELNTDQVDATLVILCRIKNKRSTSLLTKQHWPF